MAKTKRIGWFKDLKNLDPKYAKIENIFLEEDKSLPIVGNKLTRADIFEVLWNYLSGPISQRFNFTPNNKTKNVLLTISILMPFTEILAYPLSLKKISGLAATTKATELIEFNDQVLKKLLSIDRILKTIKATKEHSKFYPPIKTKIKQIQDTHESLLRDYIWVYQREERFLQTCGESLDKLKGSKFSKTEQKQIISDALKYFEAKGFKIYIKSLDRIFQKSFFEIVHSPGFLEDGTDVSSYHIKKLSTKEKTSKKSK